MWPCNITPKYRDEYCRMLGIPPLLEKGDYYVDLDKYAKGMKGAEESAAQAGKGGRDGYREQQTQAMKRPWSKKEFPILAGWLAANDKPLALLVAAPKRPRRYDPLIAEDDIAVAILLPIVGQYREAVRALTTRTMLRLDDGKLDQAWDDLLACHRLARLVGQGPTLIEEFVAIGMDGATGAADQSFLQHSRLTPGQIATMRADLDQLPPMPKTVAKFDVAERFMYLDYVGIVARQGINSLAEGFFDSQSKSVVRSLINVTAGTAIDWDQSLRIGNSWYDRLVNVGGKRTWADRRSAARKVENDLQKLAAASKDWKSPGLSTPRGSDNAVSERVGGALVYLLMPACFAAIQAEDRGTMQFELTKLAFALAAYHADRGVYPAKLAELSPKYVAEVPKDIFNASDLHYRPESDGYLLYSVGPNGKDDGGKGYDDCKHGEDWDDLVVRMLPPSVPK